MTMTDLLLKSSGPVADQYKVLAGDQVVGHIRLSEAAPTATPWRWTLSYRHHKGGRTPTHGYGATCEAAVQAFAKSWRRESQSNERSLASHPGPPHAQLAKQKEVESYLKRTPPDNGADN
jgi:hypothetical protein